MADQQQAQVNRRLTAVARSTEVADLPLGRSLRDVPNGAPVGVRVPSDDADERDGTDAVPARTAVRIAAKTPGVLAIANGTDSKHDKGKRKKKRVPRPHIQKSTPTHCVGRLQIPRTPSGANQKDYETRRRSQSKREKNYLINLINIYLDDKR